MELMPSIRTTAKDGFEPGWPLLLLLPTGRDAH